MNSRLNLKLEEERVSVLLSGSKTQNQSFRFEISDGSHVGEVRRFAMSLARQADFDETVSGRLSIVINELATNLIKHAGQGEIVLSLTDLPTEPTVEILSLDRGAGLSDLNQCFQDGYSTSSTSGTGLGAIRRQSDSFDVFTGPKGTVLYSAIRPRKLDETIHSKENYYFGGISLPMRGENYCGDGWSVRKEKQQWTIVVADGLGHGLLAHEASAAAIETMHESAHPESLPEVVREMHLHLRSTRGAAVAVCSLDFTAQSLEYLSIGNVQAVITASGGPKALLSHAGTLGLQYRQVKPQRASLTRETRLIFHSDGLTQRWNLQDYPALQFRHPAVIAGVLYRDFNRGTDDSTVVVGGWVS
jgi:anti-sigma regulatory factor (Ser/Thr protein kinase)